MAYKNWEEMMFGTALKPIITKRGLNIGSGVVIPEIVPHPRPGKEQDKKTLIREFERANGDALERCVNVGHPYLVIENEHVYQMTNNVSWGGEIAAQTANQMDEYKEKYGLISALRSTIADIRKPDIVHMRESDQTQKVFESFNECAKYADIISIESMGGKEISDYSIIRNDITGMLFAQAILGGRDAEWIWKQIVEIAKKHNCLSGGDTDCSQANTAMFMAGGFFSKNIPHTFAALSRAIGACRTLVGYECGAVGPGKDCAYENPIIKAITGVPISCEGKTSACAHSDLCGNVIAAVCDLWSNEAVEYHDMFGGSSPAVFTEILGYDTALMNASVQLGYQKQLQACLIASDRYRDPQAFILCPDNAWKIGKVITDHSENYYLRARAAAIKCGELILGDPNMILTSFEEKSLLGYMKELDSLPDTEDDFIDMCLKKYSKVKGFNPSSYGF
jgi:methanol--5-hydroxybenzimidazolylcobamide Co-methyltransferase